MLRFINRLILALSLIMIVLCALYVIGNGMNYSDSSLRSIIYADMLFSLIQAVLIAYALVSMIITVVKTKEYKHLLCLFHYLGAFLVTAFSMTLSSVLNYVQ